MVQTNIRVCCRFRPVNKREKQEVPSSLLFSFFLFFFFSFFLFLFLNSIQESKNSKLKDANLFTFAQDGRSVEAVNVEKGNRKEVLISLMGIFFFQKKKEKEEGEGEGEGEGEEEEEEERRRRKKKKEEEERRRRKKKKKEEEKRRRTRRRTRRKKIKQ